MAHTVFGLGGLHAWLRHQLTPPAIFDQDAHDSPKQTQVPKAQSCSKD